MSIELKQEQWRQRLVAYSNSGLSQQGFCERINVPLHQFKYWYRKFVESEAGLAQTQGPAWCAVQLDEESETVRSIEGISVCVGAARIEVSSGFNATLLRAVVRALEVG